MTLEAQPAITFRNVTVGFPIGRRIGGRRFVALRNLSLSIRHGEKVAVLGRNGAGKSTMLRLIAGTIAPDSGEILRSHGRCQLLTIGAGFIPHLSGRENAILGGLLQGISQREMATRLDAVADFSELGEFFDQPINTYSAGMRARLGFAVALQLEPDILLLDEVLGVGDREFRQKSREAIRERLRSDATVVLVSHDERTVAEFCDRVVWIEHGELVDEGPVEEVLRRYRDVAPTSSAVAANASAASPDRATSGQTEN